MGVGLSDDNSTGAPRSRSMRASASDDGWNVVPASAAEVPRSSVATPERAPRRRWYMWGLQCGDIGSRPGPSRSREAFLPLIGTRPAPRPRVRRHEAEGLLQYSMYPVTARDGAFPVDTHVVPPVATPRGPSETPGDAEPQALALAVHGFMNTFAGRRVRRVTPHVGVVVERFAGEPRAGAERQRGAGPCLPAPAAERAVERLAGREVLAVQEHHLVARAAADVRRQPDEVEQVELRESHYREHVHGGSRELLGLRDRHAAGAGVRRDRRRDGLGPV